MKTFILLKKSYDNGKEVHASEEEFKTLEEAQEKMNHSFKTLKAVSTNIFTSSYCGETSAVFEGKIPWSKNIKKIEWKIIIDDAPENELVMDTVNKKKEEKVTIFTMTID